MSKKIAYIHSSKVDKHFPVTPSHPLYSHTFSTWKSQIWFFPYFCYYFSSAKLMIFILHSPLSSSWFEWKTAKKSLFVNDRMNWGWLNNEKIVVSHTFFCCFFHNHSPTFIPRSRLSSTYMFEPLRFLPLSPSISTQQQFNSTIIFFMTLLLKASTHERVK